MFSRKLVIFHCIKERKRRVPHSWPSNLAQEPACSWKGNPLYHESFPPLSPIFQWKRENLGEGLAQWGAGGIHCHLQPKKWRAEVSDRSGSGISLAAMSVAELNTSLAPIHHLHPVHWVFLGCPSPVRPSSISCSVVAPGSSPFAASFAARGWSKASCWQHKHPIAWLSGHGSFCQQFPIPSP